MDDTDLDLELKITERSNYHPKGGKPVPDSEAYFLQTPAPVDLKELMDLLKSSDPGAGTAARAPTPGGFDPMADLASILSRSPPPGTMLPTPNRPVEIHEAPVPERLQEASTVDVSEIALTEPPMSPDLAPVTTPPRSRRRSEVPLPDLRQRIRTADEVERNRGDTEHRSPWAIPFAVAFGVLVLSIAASPVVVWLAMQQTRPRPAQEVEGSEPAAQQELMGIPVRRGLKTPEE